jgi:hypothetical protein
MAMDNVFGNLFGSLGGLAPKDPYQDLLKDYYDPKAAKWSMVGSALSGLGTGLMTRDWAKAAEVSGQGMSSYRDNAMKRYAAAEMMSAAEEKKQKRQEEADQKAQFEGWVKTLPPDQQGLARMFPDKYGAQMVHVPFSNPGNATTNLISGEIQLMFQLIPGIASQVKAGRVRAIGVMAAQRSPALPDVPTMVELGAPKLMSSTWFALLAPKGTPAVALERMNAALNEVLADPAVKKRLSDIGASPLGGTPKQLADHLAAEVDKWGRLVRDAKITVQ